MIETYQSYAGIFESYLNNITIEDISNSIKKVWASAYNSYTDQNTIKMGIIIMEQINSEISGIAFTADPSNGNQNHSVIESIFGQGFGIVSGEVTPDR